MLCVERTAVKAFRRFLRRLGETDPRSTRGYLQSTSELSPSSPSFRESPVSPFGLTCVHTETQELHGHTHCL